MKAPQSNSNRRYGFNMTPMIDVVFLLIIFFLVSSHLARQESQIDLDLPVAASGADDIDQETPRLTINVQPEGSLLLAGRPILASELKERFIAARAKEGDNLEVRIRGSRSAPYSTVEPIMLACTNAGIWNVTYAVFQQERP